MEENEVQLGTINGIVALFTFLGCLGIDYILFITIEPMIDLFTDSAFMRGLVIAGTLIIMVSITIGLPILIAMGKQR